MIEKYRIVVTDHVQFKNEIENAFSKFRLIIEKWRSIDRNCYVVLGADSESGEWSVVFEDGFWLVFIGERGNRERLSFFSNVWDALTYAGYRATAGRGIREPFPELFP